MPVVRPRMRGGVRGKQNDAALVLKHWPGLKTHTFCIIHASAGSPAMPQSSRLPAALLS